MFKQCSRNKCKPWKLVALAVCVFCLVISVPSAFANTSSNQLRDPTQPLNYRAAKKGASALVLQAVILGGDQAKAIINGNTVRVGDTVSGKKVLKIKPQAVVVQSGGNTRTLKLRSSIYKK